MMNRETLIKGEESGVEEGEERKGEAMSLGGKGEGKGKRMKEVWASKRGMFELICQEP
jgi:hypothetical protein